MTVDQWDGLVHALGAALGLGLWALATRAKSARTRTGLYAAVLAVGLTTFPGYDRLRGQNFLHPPEQFHYVFGAKYFPELGYTGLYDVTTQLSLEQNLQMPLHVRNLRTGLLESAASAYPRAEAFLPNFRGMRLYELTQDLRDFARVAPGAAVAAMVDHGFNGTPTWIGVARAVERDAPITRERLLVYASIDVVLLSGLAMAFFWAFGLESTALAALLLGTAWVYRFAWTGGSFLRYDWVVALGLALVALRKEKPGLAGGLLAWSTALRLFPAAFALAAGLSFLFRARDRAGRVDLARFVIGYALVAGFAVWVGLHAGRGPAAFREFGERISTHHSTWASNHIGFDSIGTLDRIVVARPSTDPNDVDPFQAYVAPVEAARHTRRPFFLVFVLGTIALVAAAARKLPPWRAMPLGAAVVFSMSAISGYYWVMLLVVPLVAERRTTLFFVLTTFLAAGIELLLNNMTAAHVVVSFAYFFIFADWIAGVLKAPNDVASAPSPTLRLEGAA